jgi:hypothetical protein
MYNSNDPNELAYEAGMDDEYIKSLHGLNEAVVKLDDKLRDRVASNLFHIIQSKKQYKEIYPYVRGLDEGQLYSLCEKMAEGKKPKLYNLLIS